MHYSGEPILDDNKGLKPSNSVDRWGKVMDEWRANTADPIEEVDENVKWDRIEIDEKYEHLGGDAEMLNDF